MAGMQRFITYIYSYEDGNKGGNTGFAKIEIRGSECRLEVHLRGIRHIFGEMPVYLFVEKTGNMLCVPVGNIKMANGNGDFGLVLNTEKIGSTDYQFKDMEGLLVAGEEDGIYASRWLEGNPLTMLKKNIQMWESKEEKVQVTPQQQVQPKIQRIMQQHIQSQNHQQQMRQSQTQERKQQSDLPPVAVTASDETAADDMDAADIQATEIPMRNFFPQYQWGEIWRNLKANYPMFLLYNNKEEIPCVRIEMKDLRELPKKYWYLGNNSFLLHGFFNYRYLILGEIEKERWFIGVPGVYQHQERVMASIFGFSDFLPQIVEPEKEQEQKEAEPFNQFGYWYHILDE